MMNVNVDDDMLCTSGCFDMLLINLRNDYTFDEKQMNVSACVRVCVCGQNR